MKKSYISLLLVFAIGCGTNQQQTANSGTDTLQQTTTNTTSNEAVKPDEGTAKVSFKVNDTLVRTVKGAHTNDQDEQIGMYTEAVKSISLSLMGDVPNRPHRGWLEFNIKDFKFEPGTYSVSKDNHVRFTRYETENAGSPTDFEASAQDIFKGTDMTITISKIEPDPNSFNGRDWLASGTFSANMLIKEANPYKRTSNEKLTISEGKFENVRIAGGPKAK